MADARGTSRRDRSARRATRLAVVALVSTIVLLVGQLVATASTGSLTSSDGAYGIETTTVDASATVAPTETTSDDPVEAEAETSDPAPAPAPAQPTQTTSDDDTSDTTLDPVAPGKAAPTLDTGKQTSTQDTTTADRGTRATPRAVLAPGAPAKITICHRTKAAQNPYVEITVSRNVADGIAGNSGNRPDHYDEHQGPIFDPAIHGNGDDWGDIIPPVDDDGNPMPHAGLNWSAQGQAIWNAGCTMPAPSATLSISKSGPADSTVGGSFNYTITVSNTGTATATNVTVTDAIAAGLTVTAVTFTSPGGNGSCTAQQSVSCNVGSLAPGQSATVTISVDVGVGACPQVTNSATVSATGLTAVTSNTVTTTVPCPANTPSLSLNKSGPATVAQGDAITYTVTVVNSGTGDAQNVVVTDDLDDVLTGVTASSTIGTCAVGAGNVVTCTIGTLPAGQSAVITIGATAPTTCPTITNQATGTHAGGTIPPSGTVTTTVTGCGVVPTPGLTVTKTADAASVAAGGSVGFTIVVSSTGTTDATSVTLNDPFPSFPGSAWTIAGGTGAAQCSITGSTLACSFGDMPGGTSKSVHVTSTTTTNSCGSFVNTAFADATNTPPVQNSANVSVTCPSAVAGIVIVKNGPATVHVGHTITYTMDVTLAAGSADLTNVSVSDPICDAGTLARVSGDDGDDVLETGETWLYRCMHVVTANDPDPIPNTATATGTGPNGTVSDSNNHIVDVIHPAIEVVKVAQPTSGSPGDVITYTFRVTNTGDTDLFNVSVDDNVIGHICDFAVLRVGATRECTATFRIPNGTAVSITNVVTATGTDVLDEEVSDTDTATIDVVLGRTVTPPPTRTPPGGLAFTGSGGNVVGLAGLMLVLLVLGAGFAWVGRRRMEAPDAD